MGILIRSPKTSECPTNIDLMFAAVEYRDLPRHLRGLEMDEPNEADISVIRERLGKSIGSEYSIFDYKRPSSIPRRGYGCEDIGE